MAADFPVVTRSEDLPMPEHRPGTKDGQRLQGAAGTTPDRRP